VKISIVSPCHIQPTKEWILALQKETKQNNADVIIVDDSNGKLDLPKEWKVFNYKKQEEYLGKELYELFKQFQHSSACKNFGLIYSYREGYDVCIVLDSDCIVRPFFIDLHVDFLTNSKGDGWTNPIPETGLYSRGFPYSQRGLDKWCHMGLWENELDLYGKDRIDNKNIPKEYLPQTALTNSPGFFPLSGMNVSFVREALPYMLFLPNFTTPEGEKFIRHDDIFGGYIFQKIAHMKNKSLSFGLPVVYHDTVVHPEEDAKEEEPMYKYEDVFYEMCDEFLFESNYCFTNLKDNCQDSIFSKLESAFEFQLQAYANI